MIPGRNQGSTSTASSFTISASSLPEVCFWQEAKYLFRPFSLFMARANKLGSRTVR
jgi:hypothetical protein